MRRIGPGPGFRRIVPSASAPAYSPLSAFGQSLLLAWFKSSVASSLFTDAGVTPAGPLDQVGQWNDLSGNGNHLTMTGSARPVRNGNVLTFNGTQKLARASLNQGVQTQAYTIAFVGTANANSASYYDNSTGVTRNLAQRGAAATTLTIFAGSLLSGTGQPDLSVTRAILCEYQGASSGARVNNGAAFTGNAGTNSFGPINLGGNSTNLLVGDLREWMAIKKILTAQERADLQAYFQTDWSLAA